MGQPDNIFEKLFCRLIESSHLLPWGACENQKRKNKKDVKKKRMIQKAELFTKCNSECIDDFQQNYKYKFL